MLDDFESGKGKKLAAEKIVENRRDVRGVGAFVHHPNLAGKEEFQASREGIYIGRGDDGDTARHGGA